MLGSASPLALWTGRGMDVFRFPCSGPGETVALPGLEKVWAVARATA
jgi:hypothetical protein